LIVLLSVLPISIISLAIQKFYIKGFCVLCIIILGWSYTLLFLGFYLFELQIRISEISQLLVSIIMAVITHFTFKKLFKENVELKKANLQLVRFKKDSNIFHFLYKESSSISSDILDNDIILKKGNGDMIITTVTNPYCGFCENAFVNYIKVYNSLDNIKIIIRFNTILNPKDDAQNKVALKLFEVYKTYGAKEFIEVYL